MRYTIDKAQAEEILKVFADRLPSTDANDLSCIRIQFDFTRGKKNLILFYKSNDPCDSPSYVCNITDVDVSEIIKGKNPWYCENWKAEYAFDIK